MLAFRLLAFGATMLAIVTFTFLSTRPQEPATAEPTSTADQPGVAASSTPAARSRAYQIVFVGDILLGDRLQPYLNQHGYDWPFEQVRSLVAGDFSIGNAEGPITSRSDAYFPKQRWNYNAQPPSAQALADLGFDALGLSNNHALDRGPDGLADSLNAIRAAGIRSFGAGMNADEASAPLLIETPYGTVGVVGIGEHWDYGATAGSDKPGTIPFGDDTIVRLKQAANAAGARWVIAFVHWGENYSKVTSEQRKVAGVFARAGYDLVVGAHPHVAQEVEIIDGMPVLYSLGNFVFGSPGRYSTDEPGLSLVARTSLGQDGFQRIELTCIETDNDKVKYQARPCSDDQSRTLLRRLGPAVTVDGDTGIVEWPRRQR
jgi:poly-gamma-glutamate capsule biosynthesis protein CapA/YwtB (metallophosphatase superfamily)